MASILRDPTVLCGAAHATIAYLAPKALLNPPLPVFPREATLNPPPPTSFPNGTGSNIISQWPNGTNITRDATTPLQPIYDNITANATANMSNSIRHSSHVMASSIWNSFVEAIFLIEVNPAVMVFLLLFLPVVFSVLYEYISSAMNVAIEDATEKAVEKAEEEAKKAGEQAKKAAEAEQHKQLDNIMDTISGAFEDFVGVNEELSKCVKLLRVELRDSQKAVADFEKEKAEKTKQLQAELDCKTDGTTELRTIIKEQAHTISTFDAQAAIDGAFHPMLLAARKQEKFARDYDDYLWRWYTSEMFIQGQHESRSATTRLTQAQTKIDSAGNEVAGLNKRCRLHFCESVKLGAQLMQRKRALRQSRGAHTGTAVQLFHSQKALARSEQEKQCLVTQHHRELETGAAIETRDSRLRMLQQENKSQRHWITYHMARTMAAEQRYELQTLNFVVVLKEKDSRIQRLQETLATAHATISSLETDVENARSSAEESEEKMQEHQKEYVERGKSLKEKRDEIRSLKAAAVKSQEFFDKQCKDQAAQMQRDIGDLKSKLQTSKHELSLSDGQKFTLDMQLLTATEDLKTAKGAFEKEQKLSKKKSDKIGELQRTVQEQEKVVKDLETEAKDLKEKLEQGALKAASDAAEIEKLRTENEDLADQTEPWKATADEALDESAFCKAKLLSFARLREEVATVTVEARKWQDCNDAYHITDSELRDAQSADEVVLVVVRMLEDALSSVNNKVANGSDGSGNGGDGGDGGAGDGPGGKKKDNGGNSDDDGHGDTGGDSSDADKSGDPQSDGSSPGDGTSPASAPQESNGSADQSDASSTTPPAANTPSGGSTPIGNGSTDQPARFDNDDLTKSIWASKPDDSDAQISPPDPATSQQKTAKKNPWQQKLDRKRAEARENPDQVPMHVENWNKLPQMLQKMLKVQQQEVRKLREEQRLAGGSG